MLLRACEEKSRNMAEENRVKVSIRLPAEDVEFIDAEVARIGDQKTDRTEQLHLCILTRRIALMPKWKRDKLAARLDVKPQSDELPLEGGN